MLLLDLSSINAQYSAFSSTSSLPNCHLFLCLLPLHSLYQAVFLNIRFPQSLLFSKAAHFCTVSGKHTHMRPEKKASSYAFVYNLFSAIRSTDATSGEHIGKSVQYNRVTFLFTSGAFWDKQTENSLVVVVAGYIPAV